MEERGGFFFFFSCDAVAAAAAASCNFSCLSIDNYDVIQYLSQKLSELYPWEKFLAIGLKLKI